MAIKTSTYTTCVSISLAISDVTEDVNSKVLTMLNNFFLCLYSCFRVLNRTDLHRRCYKRHSNTNVETVESAFVLCSYTSLSSGKEKDKTNLHSILDLILKTTTLKSFLKCTHCDTFKTNTTHKARTKILTSFSAGKVKALSSVITATGTNTSSKCF